MTKLPFLQFSTPDIGEEEIGEVVETLRSGWLTTGEKTARFERNFAAYTGARHAQAVNSCTAGQCGSTIRFTPRACPSCRRRTTRPASAT